jgi:large subunit ribosomal protein L10
MVAPKPSGFANTKAGKVKIYERTKQLFEESNLVIAFPIEGVTKEQVDMLKKEIPKATKATVVKNSILKKAAEGTSFSAIAEGLRDENMFFFIQEGDAKKTFEGFKKWQKEIKRTDAEFAAKVAVLENTKYTGANIDAVVNLPTKKELITKIAQGIKAVPTKLGKGVKAVPNKLGRAINAIKQKLEDEAKESA